MFFCTNVILAKFLWNEIARMSKIARIFKTISNAILRISFPLPFLLCHVRSFCNCSLWFMMYVVLNLEKNSWWLVPTLLCTIEAQIANYFFIISECSRWKTCNQTSSNITWKFPRSNSTNYETSGQTHWFFCFDSKSRKK